MRHPTASSTTPHRALLVADWNVDPNAVIDAAGRQAAETDLALLIPARLNGLDWAGDPYASVPCARRQLDSVVGLARERGIVFAATTVGDPDPLAAICDTLAEWPAEALLFCVRRSHMPRPFDLSTRAARQTGLAVERLDVPPVRRAARRRRWAGLRAGHCALEQPHAV